MSEDKNTLTVGDGFRLGIGLVLAQLFLATIVVLAWVSGCGALLLAIGDW